MYFLESQAFFFGMGRIYKRRTKRETAALRKKKKKIFSRKPQKNRGQFEN